jgi:hypothetical protein
MTFINFPKAATGNLQSFLKAKDFMSGYLEAFLIPWLFENQTQMPLEREL